MIQPDTKEWTWVLQRPCADCGFANWDQDATAVEDDYGAQDPADVLADMTAAGAVLADRFDSVADTQLMRTGVRSDGARFTVETFAKYLLHDPTHHVWDVERGYAPTP